MQLSPVVQYTGTPSLAHAADAASLPTRELREGSALSASIPAGRVIFWQDDAQGQEIEILKGVVRAVRLLENGSRQILAFFWPGEIIHPAPAQSQLCTAEAVTVCRLRWSAPYRASPADAEYSGADQVLREMLPLMLVMGKKTTIPRIAWFLLRIREHLPHAPLWRDAQQIVLPRADMADYLGTSIETVSRTLTEFKAKALIDLPTRKTIRFLDLPGLARIADS
jgi:CRP/FNR family transcriptional regulator